MVKARLTLEELVMEIVVPKVKDLVEEVVMEEKRMVAEAIATTEVLVRRKTVVLVMKTKVVLATTTMEVVQGD